MKPLDALTPHWPEISRVLDQALDQPLALRQAWLTDQRTLAPAVRDVVRQLLSQRAAVETDDFLATLPPLQLAPQPAGEAPAADDRVGPWRLLRELGQGGMGSVWLAERADGSLKRRVALKLPRLNWARGLAERLARERDILATLEHPHIARLYDAGVDELGRPWLALEHVQGRAIDTHCREEALSVPRRVELVLQVCAAVAYAHSRLVIHRDLKPGNILVGDDVGIAKLLDGDRASETALTLAAGRVLTLDYASPEQVRGEPLSTASDVYSLGVVAYELLAGVRPYRPRRGSAAALEDAIEHDEAPLASRASRASLAGGDAARARALRGDLDAILARALRKRPAERYASVEALAQDLRRHLAHEPVQAQPDRVAYRLAKFVRRHAVPVAAGVVATTSLAGALGLALVQAEAARMAATKAEREAERAGLVGNSLLNTLSRIASDPVFRTPEARERLGVALQTELDQLESRAASAPAGVAEAHGAAASVFNYLQQPERQLRAAWREQQLLVAAGESALRIGESHRQLALALARQVGNEAALAEAREGLTVMTDFASPDQHLLRSRLHRAAGRYARQLGLAGAAYAHTTAAVQAVERLTPAQRAPNLQHWGAALAEHAGAASDLGRDDEGLQALARIDAVYTLPTTSLREADRADIELARCQVELARGQAAAAALACRRAGELYSPQFGAVGRNADSVDVVRATALTRAGALDEAGAVLQRIRDGRSGVPAWLPSAEWALARGELVQAEQWLDRQGTEATHAVPRRRAEHHRLMAALRQAQGRTGEARAELEAALALLQRAMPGALRAERELREALARIE